MYIYVYSEQSVDSSAESMCISMNIDLTESRSVLDLAHMTYWYTCTYRPVKYYVPYCMVPIRKSV